MTPIITPFYASLLALIYIYLAKRVIDNRWKYKKGLGTVEGELEQTVRAHGNFSEYVPFSLLLILFLELQNWNSSIVHALGISLLISRVLHFTGLISSNGPSKGRFYGTAGTFLVLLLSALGNIYTSIKGLFF